MRSSIITVFNKKGIYNSEAESVKRDIKVLGFDFVEDIEVSSLYIVELDVNREELKMFCEKILIDPVIQGYQILENDELDSHKNINDEKSSSASGGEYLVDVYYKKGVMDPVAETIMLAMKDMGINPVRNDIMCGIIQQKNSRCIIQSQNISNGAKVSTGKRYLVKMKDGKEQLQNVKKIAEKVFCNTIIQDYKVIKIVKRKA